LIGQLLIGQLPPSESDIHHQFYNICGDYKVAENNLITQEDIKYKIYKIRDTQVMLDRDLALFYKVDTRVLNQAVKRNIIRFPKEFMFKLNSKEIDLMVSQNVIPSKMYLGGATPSVFTEQGVAMLSGILRTKTAIDISIQIINAFVSMRRFISRNAEIFTRLDSVERKQLEYQIRTDNNFKKVFDAIESKDLIKKQGVFFDGQVFDAHKFVSDLIRSAKKSIILIDNYIDDSVLILFTKVNKNVRITIYTANITKQLELDIKKYNLQYSSIELKKLEKSHDRFLIIDNKDVFHSGASIKDLGKKWFAISKLDKESIRILDKLDDN